MSPTDVIFLNADSSEELIALKQMRDSKDGILIDLEQSMRQI